jgi:cation-transporting ATPase E
MEVDESLLTGESEPISKRVGDLVFSGSYCVSGSALYEAQLVGQQSRANQLTIRARAFRQEKTPLQHDIELVIRVMVIIVVLVAGPVIIDLAVRLVEVVTRWLGPLDEPLSAALQHAYEGYSAREIVRAAAVVVALVPQGLALMIVVTYAAAALRLAGRGTLVQAANAIESLSHVDLLCLDKTGTLTTNQLVVETLEPLSSAGEVIARQLGDFVATQSDRNRTSVALAASFPGQARAAIEAVPFSSARKWSAIACDDPALRGTFVLGAPEVLAPALRPGWDLTARVAAWTSQGRRVLLFACRNEPVKLRDAAGQPRLPAGLDPLALVVLADELRPDAREVMAHFASLGIRLRLISGDDPNTVAALARQAGFPEAIETVSGEELERASEQEFAELAQRGTIFGRTTPEQKERLIRAFRDQGHYVAMIGDGVNDVLALKQAQVGIAMRSGSAATRGVADLILLADSFAVLPLAFQEGQRIMGGMRDIISLFLTRSLSVLAIILGAGLVGAPFPIPPKHNSVLALLTVGIPTLALAVWAKAARDSGKLLRRVMPFVLPAVLLLTPVTLTLYLSWWRVTGDATLARTVLTSTAIIAGLLLVPFVQPPTPAWAGGDELSGDWRPTILAGILLALYVAGLESAWFRQMFELQRLSVTDLVVIGAGCLAWAVATRWAWRSHILERLLGFSSSPKTSRSPL